MFLDKKRLAESVPHLVPLPVREEGGGAAGSELDAVPGQADVDVQQAGHQLQGKVVSLESDDFRISVQKLKRLISSEAFPILMTEFNVCPGLEVTVSCQFNIKYGTIY